MARADLLLALVRAAVVHDDVGIRGAVVAIAAEERASRHGGLASRLERALPEQSTGPVRQPTNVPPEPEALVTTVPRTTLDDLALPAPVRARLDGLIREQRCAGKLRDNGLQPRNRVLLSGPPGNGKTSVAGALAIALGYPLLVVSHGALVGSQLGETNRRLDRILHAAALRPAVLFLDEFDALGKERDDAQETGEMKRVVASLLLGIDALPTHVVIVGATNHPGLLDRAIWRRFQLRLELPCPDRAALRVFVAARIGDAGDGAVASVCDALAGHSYAEAEDFLQDVARRSVMEEKRLALADIVELELSDRFPGRPGLTDHGIGPHQTPSPPQPAAGRGSTRRKPEERPKAEGILPW